MVLACRGLGVCLVLWALCAGREQVQERMRGARRAEPQPEAAGGLPFCLEVWAAALVGGEPVVSALGRALSCCAASVASPLLGVRDGLAAGKSSTEAWADALEGSPSHVPTATLVLIGQACVRSEHDGTPLAPVLRHLAAEERAAAASRGLVAARRAGVLAVVPLGLCTLPAYVLLSVVPAVIGLIRHPG